MSNFELGILVVWIILNLIVQIIILINSKVSFANKEYQSILLCLIPVISAVLICVFYISLSSNKVNRLSENIGNDANEYI
jgi:hypothetical protein